MHRLRGAWPREVPVDPDAPEARDWLVRELANPEYEAARPTWFDLLAQRVVEWFESLRFTPGEGGFPQPYVLEWWRSQYSKEAIIANLQHLRTLYTAGQTFGIDDLIAHEQYADPPHQELAAAITNQFDAALNKLAAFDTSLFSAPSDPELKQALLDIHSDITALVHLLEDELPKAMGLSLSFNANDGD